MLPGIQSCVLSVVSKQPCIGASVLSACYASQYCLQPCVAILHLGLSASFATGLTASIPCCCCLVCALALTPHHANAPTLMHAALAPRASCLSNSCTHTAPSHLITLCPPAASFLLPFLPRSSYLALPSGSLPPSALAIIGHPPSRYAYVAATLSASSAPFLQPSTPPGPTSPLYPSGSDPVCALFAGTLLAPSLLHMASTPPLITHPTHACKTHRASLVPCSWSLIVFACSDHTAHVHLLHDPTSHMHGACSHRMILRTHTHAHYIINHHQKATWQTARLS
jgi:hypothetical protein